MGVLTDYFASLGYDYYALASAVGMSATYAKYVDQERASLLTRYRRALAEASGSDETELALLVANLDSPVEGGIYRHVKSYAGGADIGPAVKSPAATIASPLEVPNCRLWLTADVGLTYTPPGYLANVTGWDNQGLAGGTFTGSGSPFVLLDGINGKPAVCTGATAGYLYSTINWSDIATTSAFTLFALVRLQDGPALVADSYYNAPILGNTGGTVGYDALFYGWNAGTFTGGLYLYDGGDRSARATVQPHRPVVLTGQYKSGTLVFTVNNGTPVVTTSVGAQATPEGTVRLFTQGTIYAKCRARHILAYNRALTDVEVLRVQRFLMLDGGV
jgi:hypothetical protein